MSIHFSTLRQTAAGFLAALMLAAPLTASAQAAKISDYSDAGGHPLRDALTWAVEHDVLARKSENRLAPDDYLTRAQLAAMIGRLFSTYKNADISQYTDTLPGSWCYDSIAQAVNMGTLAGCSASLMKPDDFVSCEQAIAILARTLCLSTSSRKALKQFSDRSAISDWASGAVSAMAERKYVTASVGGRLNLKGSMTRAEMAEIMARAFRNVHDSGELTGTYRDTVLVRGKSNIHDATFKGDLILANSLPERELDLDDVTIEGRLIVWGGSEIRVNGDSTVAGVVTPRNDGRVRVIFDETASELSEEVCDVVYPKSMHKKNRVIFTEKEEEATPAVPAPTIGFELPQYLYVGDSMNIEATLTDAESVKWVLTKDGIEVVADGFTENGGVFAFTEPGRYVLQGTAENSNGSTVCEQSVEVLPVGDLAFSLSEYGYTDTAEDVNLLRNNGLSGVAEWTLTRDGEAFPLPGGFTLALSEVGEYVLTAKLTDAAGTQYTAAQKIIILPVLKPALAASVERLHEGEAAEIGLTVESGETASIRWSMNRDGKPVPLELGNQGGRLSFDAAGEYVLTAAAVDAQGREFASKPVSIGVIENLVLMLTADPEKLHVDETSEVGLPVEHGAPSAVAWSLTCGGEEIPVSLENDGGTLSFEETGAYVLTATATDELGKVFTETATLEVWPLIDLTLDMPEAIPVDQSASVSLHGTDLSVMWKVTAEDGTVFTPALYKEGGEITFPAAGTYTVTASVTDELGSTFHASGAI
ncbi:hypothetical protein D3Z52_19300 [Clostridiaceae bacterium]|nr:hypothetical protein [Clostridiaceae bacterium]